MTRFATFVAFLLCCADLTAQSFAGDWRGEVRVPGSPLEVQIALVERDGTWSGTIDIPAQEAKALPLAKFVAKDGTLQFVIADVPGNPTFAGTLDAAGDVFSGSFTQGSAKLVFSLQRAAAAAANEAARFLAVPAWLDETRAMFYVPGCAAIVVKRGAVAGTFVSGLRDVGNDLPVTPDTLFAIGSSTKAFTTCLLALLVDDGALEWDAPVRRWLPDFALADAPLGERITPRDLVTHRSGMPRHDLVWYGATFERADMVRRLQHLPLNHDLRTDFQYNNLMFLAAGHLAERIRGASWEDLVQRRILSPLGMARSNFAVATSMADADHAVPYRKEKAAVNAIPFRDISAIGPAGSINSSVRDMANWVALHLQRGTFGGTQLLGAATVDDLHTVRMATGGVDRDTPEIVDVGYALGWFVDVYRGHRRVHHGGNIDGFSALVTLLPDAGYGFVVLTNLDGSPLPEIVVRHLADTALGLEPRDFRTEVRARTTKAEAAGEKAKVAAEGERRQGTQPSHPLTEYAGDYWHAGYGACRVVHEGGALRIDFHGIAAALEHWHHDVFVCREDPAEPTLGGTKVQFASGFDGDVESVRAMLEPHTPPIVFQKQADARSRDPVFLQQLAGEYELDSAMATVTRNGDKLVVTLPGQRYELEPRPGLVFDLAGLHGYSLRFRLDEQGLVTGAVFRQPDGVFEAKRRPPAPR